MAVIADESYYQLLSQHDEAMIELCWSKVAAIHQLPYQCKRYKTEADGIASGYGRFGVGFFESRRIPVNRK